MSNDWLTASSFERAHEVIAAVNTLSISAKLILANKREAIDKTELQTAKEQLLAFLTRFQAVLDRMLENKDGTILGTDSRMGELAMQFLAQSHGDQPSGVPLIPLEKLRAELENMQPQDLSDLILHLRNLKLLMEQHVHVDTLDVLGDL